MTPETPSPLAGIKVVDLSQMIAGPSAAVLLADYGADVIKIEPPGGDGGRLLRSGPALSLSEAPVFTAYSRNKRSTRLDLREETARNTAWRLIEQADVIIASSVPGAMGRLGLGHEQVLARCPRIIYAAISGFGEESPGRARRGLDLIVQAESGIMAATGLPEAPVKVGFTVVDASAGHALCHGILAALLRRERTGRGGYVRTSLYEVALHLQTAPLAEYLATGVQEPRSGSTAPLSSPAGLMRCRDGALVVSAYIESHWQAFCRAIGDEALLSDPRFEGGANRVKNRQALTERIEARLVTKTTAEWQAILQAAGLVTGELKDYAQVVADPCAEAAGMIAPMEIGFAVRNPVTLPDSERPKPTNRVDLAPGDLAFRA
jgi:crotonobetainyl-CoA:carnitine CoA-transferase CaiB-like acyl-CoA transferase